MAVSLADLAVALRLKTGAEVLDTDISAILMRIKQGSEAIIGRYAPEAPDAIKDLACIRLGSYLFDEEGRSNRSKDPLKASGAQQLLARFRNIRLNMEEAVLTVAELEALGFTESEIAALRELISDRPFLRLE